MASVKGRTFEAAMAAKIAKTHAVMEQLPEQVNRVALQHFKRSFQRGGFTDKSFQKWKPKKTGEPSYLTKTRRLRNSFKTEEDGNVGRVINTAPYAKFHNKGIANMPKRKFMGNSEVLNGKIRRVIVLQINLALHA